MVFCVVMSAYFSATETAFSSLNKTRLKTMAEKGDKKAQKFEDDYLDLLIEELHRLKFDAITYMPTRNTPEQLARIIGLCQEHGFFQISGEDINSPRQSFRCKALDNPAFHHLIDATYTLIGYENAASEDLTAAKEKYAHIFRA